ncbi:hypothetical protein Tco_1122202 [Tanacetum coccineum]|uniref:Uncharacterized protein n=1 Tax=Tanacetum coccineum TaxID=301880 RepID=A0ABQ5IZW8_9ASTR
MDAGERYFRRAIFDGLLIPSSELLPFHHGWICCNAFGAIGFPGISRVEVTKLTTGRLVNGSSCDGFDMESYAGNHIPRVWKSVRYGVSKGLDTAYLEFLEVGTTFDIFQNIHILYLQYGVLTSSGYGVLSFIPLWSLVSAGTDTPYLP